MTSPDRISPVLRAALESSSYLLEDLVLTPAGRRSVLRVVIDTDPGESAAGKVITASTPPLSLDEVADASRLINAALDESDVMGEAPYTLEVTSPGVSRPLTLPRHFQRNVGRLVTAVGADEPVTGRLVEAGPAHIVLDVPSTKKVDGGPRRLELADIRRGEVQVEFNRPDADEEPADSLLGDLAHDELGQSRHSASRHPESRPTDKD